MTAGERVAVGAALMLVATLIGGDMVRYDGGLRDVLDFATAVYLFVSGCIIAARGVVQTWRE